MKPRQYRGVLESAEPAQPGREINLSYRLYWGAQPPVRPSVAEIVATMIGVGGNPGQKKTVPMQIP